MGRELRSKRQRNYNFNILKMEELNVIKQAIEIAVKAGVYQMADVVALSQILDKLAAKLQEDETN